MRPIWFFPALGGISFRLMIRIFLAALTSAAAGSVLAAQTTTLSVRGGEHADFTRLVIHMPDENHWRLSQSERQATLQVTGPPLQFDLAQTFTRIPRTRLRNLIAQPDALLLELACDCDVRASEDIPQFLVIDIIGSTAATSEPARATLRPRARPQPGEPTVTGEAVRAGQVLARKLRDRNTHVSDSVSLTLQQLFDTVRIVPPDMVDQDDQPRLVRSAVTDEIGLALAGSVALGQLQGNASFSARGLANDMNHQSENDAGFGIPDRHIRIAPSGRDNPDSGADNRSDTNDFCRESDLVETALWDQSVSPDADFFAIENLYDERDRPNTARIHDLVRYLLYLGFGAEARMALHLHAEPSRDAALLTQIGYLVDLEPAPEPDPIAALGGCSPMSTLWAFLAVPTDLDGLDLRIDMLTQAVQSLPPHLRIHLGPTIIKRLTMQGQSEAAQLVQAAIDRIVQTPTPALELARLKLDLSTGTSGDTARSQASLSPERSDDMLLFLLEQHEETDQLLDPGLLELAQDRLLALRGTQQGQQAAGHVLRAMLRAHLFHEAWEFLEQRPPPLRDAYRLAAHEVLLRAITHEADDPTFLTLVFAQSPWREDFLDPQLLDSVAERLDALGFYEQGAMMRLRREPASPVSPAEADEISTNDKGAGMSDLTKTAAPADSAPNAPTARSEASHATAPLSRDVEVQVIDRAREVQARLAEAQLASASRAVPDPTPRQPAPLAVTSAFGNTGGTAPPARQETVLPRSVTDHAQPTGAEGLLGQGRAVLSESIALRERLQSMLQASDAP